MENYFILLNGRPFGPLKAAEAAALSGFGPETPVKNAGSASAGWIAAGAVPELASILNCTLTPAPGAAAAETGPETAREGAALNAADEALKQWLDDARRKIDDFFPALRESWEREKEKAAARLEKKLDGEISSVYAEIRKRVEKAAAGRIKEFADMAAAELAAGRRAVFKELQPLWEKLSAETAAEFDDSLRKFREFNRKKQREIDTEVRKHMESLTRLNTAGAETIKAMEAENENMRRTLSIKAQQFSDSLDELILKLREQAADELEKKLGSEIIPVSGYAEIRKRVEKAAAGRIKEFADMAAAELAAGRSAMLKGLEAGWESLSSRMTAEFDGSLREFKRRGEENFSKVLSEQAAESEFLSREAREKMGSVSAEFLNRITEMKAWLERTAGELDKAREAVAAAAQAKLLAAAAGEKEVPAPDGQLGERLLELERRISKEMLDRKLGAVRSEIPVIIGSQKGARGKFPAAGAGPLYSESYSLKDNFTLIAALIAVFLSILSLLAR